MDSIAKLNIPDSKAYVKNYRYGMQGGILSSERQHQTPGEKHRAGTGS